MSLASIQFAPGRMPRLRHGQIADSGVREERGDLEIAGRAAQTQTITLSGSVNLAAYSVEIPELGGLVVSFVGGASDTLSAAALVAAWNAEPVARGFAVASNAAGVVTLAGTGIGGADWDITIVPSSAVMTVAETVAPADPPDYPVGVAVYLDSNGRATRTPPTAGSFIITPAAVNSAVYYFSFTAGNGPESKTFYITYTADGSATVQEIVEGLKADFDRKVPSSIATAAEDNTKITVSGAYQSITLLAQDANSTPSAQVVGAGLLDKLIGFSYLDYQNEVNASGNSVHRGQRRVVFLRAGAIGSNLSGNSSKWLDQAYLGVDSGNAAEYGNVYDASGSGRIALPKSAVVWGARPNVFEIRLGR